MDCFKQQKSTKEQRVVENFVDKRMQSREKQLDPIYQKLLY